MNQLDWLIVITEGFEMAFVKNWFSNMQPFEQPLKLRQDGEVLEFATPENFYQAMKTTDLGLRIKLAGMNPYQAKKFSRTIALRPDWNDVKLGVMEYALRKKFAPGTKWAEKLIATGDEEIVEWNNWGDRFWGKTLDGRGENHLGRLLMKIRGELR